MQAIFYNCTSDERVLSKRLSTIANVTNCDLKEPCDILRPSLLLNRTSVSGYASCNYMYIPTFKRYYYVKFTALEGDLLQVDTIKPDPLMSFANGIRAITCTILRQQYKYNNYFIDNQLGIRQTKNIQRVNVGTYNAGTGIYLTVDGGEGE